MKRRLFDVKKILKIILVLLMIIGTVISISNFTSVEINAVSGTRRGIEVERPDGTFKCMDDGDECDILGNG
jgi:hypothetical protein